MESCLESLPGWNALVSESTVHLEFSEEPLIRDYSTEYWSCKCLVLIQDGECIDFSRLSVSSIHAELSDDPRDLIPSVLF
ncbi:hypothetical protein ACLOJK_017970 [Asimina triloba]